MAHTKASDNEMFMQTMLMAFLAPLLGYIVGIIYLAKNELVDRRLGMALIWASLLASVFYGLTTLAIIKLAVFLSQ